MTAGVLEHVNVAVGIAGRHNWPAPDGPVDVQRLAGTVVDRLLDLFRAHHLGNTLRVVGVGECHAAANGHGARDAVNFFTDCTHEIAPAARRDIDLKVVVLQIMNQFYHRPVGQHLVRLLETRVLGLREELQYVGIKCLGRDAFQYFGQARHECKHA